MGFQQTTCSFCHNTYEWYQARNEVPPCPVCGANGFKPLTAAEYYKSMGVATNHTKDQK